ncbi:MAG: sulfite exporter TauE/SafE family protein [Acidobacteriota bacterium]
MTVEPLHVLAGALTGLVVGLTGVGGGALMTPLLLLWFGVSPQVAVGTDLWFAAVTKLAATPIYHRKGLVDWMVLRRLWAGSLPASALTLTLLARRGLNEHVAAAITVMMGIAVCLTAIALFLHDRVHAGGRQAPSRDGGHWQGPLTVVGGATLGVLISLTSIGAGAVGAIVLARLYPTRMTPGRLVATDVVQAIPLAMFAAVGHTLIGSVDLALLAELLMGSIPAVLIGARLSSRLPHQRLRFLLGTVLLLIGIRLLVT